MNNLDMNTLMSMLSKMDKKDIEKGLSQASKILNSKDKDSIINEIKKNNQYIKLNIKRELDWIGGFSIGK